MTNINTFKDTIMLLVKWTKKLVDKQIVHHSLAKAVFFYSQTSIRSISVKHIVQKTVFHA